MFLMKTTMVNVSVANYTLQAERIIKKFINVPNYEWNTCEILIGLQRWSLRDIVLFI